jgi:hypothetical protein
VPRIAVVVRAFADTAPAKTSDLSSS